MTKWAYYNEINKDACEWLRELMRRGYITEGEIDERSITEVQPDDVRHFRRRHWFAGVAGWEFALNLADWPDDKPVDTASCPCQPLSCAGEGNGHLDIRHLWPELYRIRSQLESRCTFGEQVASPLGIQWIDGVSLDLEGLGYAVGAFDLPAASVGAPHIRQRLYWVADPDHERCVGFDPLLWPEETGRNTGEFSETAGRCSVDRMADANGCECGGISNRERRESDRAETGWIKGDGEPQFDRAVGGLADASIARPLPGPHAGIYSREEGAGSRHGESERCGDVGRLGHPDHARPQGRRLRFDDQSRWRTPWPASPSFIPCSDGKSRRFEPGIFPLVDGIPSRVGPMLTALRPLGKGAVKAARSNRIVRLHAYGNAIVPELAAQFISAWRDANAGGGLITIEVD